MYVAMRNTGRREGTLLTLDQREVETKRNNWEVVCSGEGEREGRQERGRSKGQYEKLFLHDTTRFCDNEKIYVQVVFKRFRCSGGQSGVKIVLGIR